MTVKRLNFAALRVGCLIPCYQPLPGISPARRQTGGRALDGELEYPYPDITGNHHKISLLSH
jgi:hypothetical protein